MSSVELFWLWCNRGTEFEGYMQADQSILFKAFESWNLAYKRTNSVLREKPVIKD